MDTKKLEMLVSTVDLGSFSRAAEAVGYTQSGLTHMMDALERELGISLLERGHAGVRPTPAGEALLPAIRDFLRASASLDSEIERVRAQSRQTIRVAAYASIAMHWLPPLLYRFKRECPGIDIELRMVDHALEPFELLRDGRADLIFASRQKAMECEWTPLYTEPICAILPKDYPLNGRNVFPITEFAGQEFLMPYGRFDIEVRAAFERAGMTLDARQARVDDETVIRMVEHGLGVSMMAELMFRGRTAGVRCVPVDPPAQRELGMGLPKGQKGACAVKLAACAIRALPDILQEG